MAIQDIQFIDNNLMLSRLAMINNAAPPISTLFGNLPGGNTATVSSSSISAEGLSAREGIVETSAAIFKVDLGADKATSNIICIFNGLQLSRTVELVAVPIADPTQGVDYSGLETYKGWRAGPEIFYLNVEPSKVSRYWHLLFIGGMSLELSDIFVGQSVNVNSAISSGLAHQTNDPSQITYADSGRAYAVRRPLYQVVNSLTLPFLDRGQVTEFKRFSERKGLTEPFWVAIDPANLWDGPSFGATFGAYRFASMPNFSHAFLDKFNVSFSLREVL